MYLVIGIALMVVALIGIIWCQKKQKTNPNAQAFAFVFLILIIAGAGTVLWDQGIFGGEDREMNKIIKKRLMRRRVPKSSENTLSENMPARKPSSSPKRILKTTRSTKAPMTQW